MTAFDKLCRMLDERGARYFRKEREGKGTLAKVAWLYPTGPDSSDVFIATVVRYGDYLRFCGYLTPEQAVEATLGRGTCKVEGSIDYGEFGCWQYDLSCGCRIIWPDSEPPRFCPECGRRIVEHTTNDADAEVTK